MAFLNAKRKRAEGTYGDGTLNESHKRHHSDHPLLSPIDYRAAMQLRNRNTHTSTKDSKPKSNPHPKQPSFNDGSEVEDEDEEIERDEDDDSSTNPDNNLSSDEVNYPPEAQKEEESESEDEAFRAARLEAETEAEAHFQENWSASDAESDLSSESSVEWASDTLSNSDGEPHADNRKKEKVKADDPNAFATSMRGILGHKLTRAQRANPILARSADAKEADEVLLDMKLEKKARAEMRRQKRENGGGYSDPNDLLREIHGGGGGDKVGPTVDIDDAKELGSISAYQQREKDLRKIAQRGVVKMFNAFSHVREKTAEAQGLGGSRAKKAEKATEMSKEGWLEYVGLGGKEKSKGKVEGESGLSTAG